MEQQQVPETLAELQQFVEQLFVLEERISLLERHAVVVDRQLERLETYLVKLGELVDEESERIAQVKPSA